ncbi:hypothetical protein GOZ81_10380 [Agrobacterium vitis]|uniref:hypothetical protein n=1 Tax=Agrobacterium vitis TaxID=373 RepID=UPI0012E784C6|nr:hypothetical protein [Agrobacterium vitis]MVA71481.1 hypothetical protein [Agrobacterium vitis]
MKKKLAAGSVGFSLGLLVFAVGREIAIDPRPWPQLISDALRVVGRLGWIDTTLVTGLAAVAAAVFSIRAVAAQIKASDAAVQRQIDHATLIEKNRNDAKHTAIRAAIPLALSDLINYCVATLEVLETTHGQCVSGVLPKIALLANFPTPPKTVVSDLKELIEFSKSEDRRFIWQILVSFQILQARLAGLRESHSSATSIVMELNVEAYIVNAADLMARVSAYFNYARGFASVPPKLVTRSEVAGAMSAVIWHMSLSTILARYRLTSDEPWEPWTRDQ